MSGSFADNAFKRHRFPIFHLPSTVTVLNFASIRFAVNLCVIGALLLPGSGVALVSAGATCGVAESGPAKCPGCGHCEVSQSGDRCGCCSEAQEPPHGGCCELTAVKKETSDVQTLDAQWGVCLCGDQPLPQVPAPQHRSATEQLVRVVMMAPATFAVAAMDSSVVPSIEEASVPPSLLPRDSQRRLGIWLI